MYLFVIDFSLLANDADPFPIRPWKAALHEALAIHCSFDGLTEHEMEQGVQLLARAWSNVFAPQM
ncbi:hypothetical protein AB4Z29_21380 [Paenibacillus sp. 2TAB23]|uniref:hypothetical protein n=1 Tax=Paenibacillus sp. 2TAB23 TaxID=3233004 RepID=UPI003F945F91